MSVTPVQGDELTSSGVYAVNESSGTDFGASLASARALNIGTVNDSGEATGSISTANDEDWIAVRLDSQSTYIVSLQGDTLRDPYLRGIYNAEGVRVHWGNDDGGNGLNSHLNFSPSESGVYFISAGAYSSHTGSYTMSVTAELDTGVSSPPPGEAAPTSTLLIGEAAPTPTFVIIDDAVSTCQVAHTEVGVTSIGGGASAFGWGAYAIGGYFCGGNAFACGAAAYAIGTFACGGNAYACGANVFVAGSHSCAANASSCGVAANVALVSGCTANVGACGAAASWGLIVGCLGNANVCGVDVNIIPDVAYSVACAIDLGFGADVGVCAINIFPILPSC
jgi:hypothetical protein